MPRHHAGRHAVPRHATCSNAVPLYVVAAGMLCLVENRSHLLIPKIVRGAARCRVGNALTFTYIVRFDTANNRTDPRRLADMTLVWFDTLIGWYLCRIVDRGLGSHITTIEPASPACRDTAHGWPYHRPHLNLVDASDRLLPHDPAVTILPVAPNRQARSIARTERARLKRVAARTKVKPERKKRAKGSQ